MGLFDFFKRPKGNKNKQKLNLEYAPTMSAYSPTFNDFGDNIYASDIVVQAIRCKANEFKKLNPRHIKIDNGTQTIVTDSSISRVLKRPNNWMTTADFLEKIMILLELNKNVYIYPDYYVTKGGYKYYTGLYPLRPSRVEYLTDSTNNKLYIRFQFATGYTVTLPQDEVIHWRKDYGINDYFGGGIAGHDEAGLLKMLSSYDTLIQSIAQSVKCSMSINGIMKYGTFLNEAAMTAERAKFEEALRNGDSGIAVMDLKSEYIPIERDIKLVDKDTLNFFYETILRNVGVSVPILNGDYTTTQKEAFYEHALEGDVISLGQAISNTMFSSRETSFGNEVVLYPARINFMSMSEKISYLSIAAPAGAVNKNEIREFAGLPPMENGEEYPRAYNSLDSDTMNTPNIEEEGENE